MSFRTTSASTERSRPRGATCVTCAWLERVGSASSCAALPPLAKRAVPASPAGLHWAAHGPAIRIASRRLARRSRWPKSHCNLYQSSMGDSRALALAASAMRICRSFALLAQLVEHFHGKEGVAGSSPAEGFTKPAGNGGFFGGRSADPKVSNLTPASSQRPPAGRGRASWALRVVALG
jgi:hypothetical protein